MAAAEAELAAAAARAGVVAPLAGHLAQLAPVLDHVRRQETLLEAVLQADGAGTLARQTYLGAGPGTVRQWTETVPDTTRHCKPTEQPDYHQTVKRTHRNPTGQTALRKRQRTRLTDTQPTRDRRRPAVSRTAGASANRSTMGNIPGSSQLHNKQCNIEQICDTRPNLCRWVYASSRVKTSVQAFQSLYI